MGSIEGNLPHLPHQQLSQLWRDFNTALVQQIPSGLDMARVVDLPGAYINIKLHQPYSKIVEFTVGTVVEPSLISLGDEFVEGAVQTVARELPRDSPFHTYATALNVSAADVIRALLGGPLHLGGPLSAA